jgi:ABC-type transporter Mla subunit MlaD
MLEIWTDARLDRLATTVESTSVKLDSFIFEASRLFAKLGESQARNDAATETLLQAATRLTQSQETQWQAIREMQSDVREMQTEVRGLQVENRRILQRVFGLADDEF